jgi:hypothetical protein
MLGFLLGVAACLITPTRERILRTPSRIALALGALLILHLIGVFPYRDHLRRGYPREGVAELKDAYGSLKDQGAGRILDAQHYNPLADMLGAVVARRPSGWGWLSWSSSRFTSDVIHGGVYRSLAKARAAGRSGASDMETAADLAALANIRYLSRIASRSPPLPASDSFRPVWENPRIEIFENLRALPYLQFYPGLALVSGSTQRMVELVGQLARDGIASYTLTGSDPLEDLPSDLRVHFWHGARARALFPESALQIGPARRLELDRGRDGSYGAAPCAVDRKRAARIALHCQFAQEGYLVVSESWFPSWQAAINGERRPVLRLNHAFQGLQVSPGVAEVEFWYEPSRWVEASMLISGLSWIGLALLGIGYLCSALRRKPSQGQPATSSSSRTP